MCLSEIFKICRWVKFEEVLEEKGKRWSKPHVSSLYMQSLTELHTLMASNTCILDMEALSMYDIVGREQQNGKFYAFSGISITRVKASLTKVSRYHKPQPLFVYTRSHPQIHVVHS